MDRRKQFAGQHYPDETLKEKKTVIRPDKRLANPQQQ